MNSDTREAQATKRSSIYNKPKSDTPSNEGQFIYDSNHEIVPPAFQNWGADEPNDWNNAEDCVEVKPYNNEYFWNDISCYDKVRALCERVKEGTYSY